jgi:hypothetical protein
VFLHRGIKDGLFKASMGIELGFNLLKSRFCSFLSSVSVADVSNVFTFWWSCFKSSKASIGFPPINGLSKFCAANLDVNIWIAKKG